MTNQALKWIVSLEFESGAVTACTCSNSDCLSCLQVTAQKAKDTYLLAYYKSLIPEKQKLVLELMDNAPAHIDTEYILDAVLFGKTELIEQLKQTV